MSELAKIELRCRDCQKKFKVWVVKPDMLCPNCSHKKAKAQAKLRGMVF